MNNKTYYLHFASLDNKGDIPLIKFDGKNELYGYILADATIDSIYLVSIFDEVYVTKYLDEALFFLDNLINKFDLLDEYELFFQEYDNFSTAYRVAEMISDDIIQATLN